MRFAGASSALQSLFGDKQSPKYDELANIGIEGRSQERNAATSADAQAEMADINADATVKAAKFGAQAIAAQGAAAGQSAMFGGLSSGIGSIAGGIGSRMSAPTGVPRASAGMGIPGSVAPGTKLPYYGPSF
jgi:membrane protein involved in colicin uptake